MNAAGAEPAQPVAAAVLAALGDARDLVLQAPTGAGKSTLVPLALLQHPAVTGRILMLEPRRLAARAVAARMASLIGETVGQRVGYRMRMDTRVSRDTRIEVVTEGVLTRLLQEDPSLEGVSWVIFDEFHERSLQADAGLALALDARATLGAAFRILVMSATLDGERVRQVLGDAVLVSVPGRAYPVEIRYVGRGSPRPPQDFASAREFERAMTAAVREALQSTTGDVLVFLPGVGEIRQLQGTLSDSGALVLPLYGDMRAADQDAVLAPAPPGRRKVVLATNIAETSLTIPGVTAVVDSGLVRRSRFYPGTGMARLELMAISRASAEQRAGRAGRVAPGVCLRVWSEGAMASMAAESVPEILESDLAPLVLELVRWGNADGSKLPWLDAPPRAAVNAALDLLRRLGAVDNSERLTTLGQSMAKLPLHPRMACMLQQASALGGEAAVDLAAELAALLSERDPLRGSNREAELQTRLDALHGRGSAQVDAASLERIGRVAKKLAQSVRVGTAPRVPRSVTPGALLALGFPDMVGRRRAEAGIRADMPSFLLANGRAARFTRIESLARAEWLVAAQLDAGDTEATIRLATALDAATLDAVLSTQIVEESQFGWDARAAAVVSRSVRRLGALLLEERVLPAGSDARSIEAMIAGLRQMGLAALPWDDACRSLCARMEFVRNLKRSDVAEWPATDDNTLMATLEEWLAPWLANVTRRDHLAGLPLHEALIGRLDHAQRKLLDTLAPRSLTVPTGSSIAVDYQDEGGPSLSVRLQEVFGLLESPRVGGGAVPVTFKLLSPAGRPVQVTRDLAGFWRGSYAEVRKDMRGRYPKHFWPENPWEAAPTRGTRRPRK